MSPFKLYVGLAVAILLSVGATLFYHHYQSLVEAAHLAEVRKGTAANASATVIDGQAADTAAQKVEFVLTDTRDTFTHNQSKAKANEPETAQRADRVVPVSVRNNFKQRRLARERLGCVSVQCEAGDAAGNPSER